MRRNAAACRSTPTLDEGLISDCIVMTEQPIKERDLYHPVWQVYDLLRTSKLNVLYYSACLARAERAQLTMHIVLAAAVPSSAVAGLSIWDFWLGDYAWEAVVAFSSLLAFSQPFLGLPKKIRVYDRLLSGYKVLYFDLIKLRNKIESDQCYENKHKKLLDAALDRWKKLEVQEVGLPLKSRLRRRCENTVRAEYAGTTFFIPSEG